MLFKITKEDIFKDNPELNSIEAFSKCTDRQLKYVFYVYDYKSPLRTMETEARKEKAARLAGYKLEKDNTRLDKNGRSIVGGTVRSVNEAIKEFREIQRDVDREALLAIENQIEEVIKIARKKDLSAKELETSIKLSKELPRLAEIKKELAKILNIRDAIPTEQESDDTIVESQLSTLDRLHAKE